MRKETPKQKAYRFRNSMNYAKEKGACKSFFTSRFDSKSRKVIQLYSDILDVWKVLEDYKQVSSGINHTRRDVIVIDSDFENSADYKSLVFSERVFMNYSYCITNPETHHSQYGILLDEPLSNQSEEFKAMKKEIVEYINAFFGQEVVKQEAYTSKGYADKNFTQWQCKNPFNKSFEVDGDFKKHSTREIKLALQNLKLLCKIKEEKKHKTECSLYNPNYTKVTESENSVQHTVSESSRYINFTKLFRTALLKKMSETNKTSLSTETLKRLTSECRIQSAEMCGKELEESESVIRQAKAIYTWVINYGYTKAKREMAEHASKLKRLSKIVLLKEILEEMTNSKIESDTLEEAYRNLRKKDKSLVLERTNFSKKVLNELIRCSIEEYKDNALDFYYKLSSFDNLNEKHIYYVNKIEELLEKTERSLLNPNYTKVTESEIEEESRINNKMKHNNETLCHTSEKDESVLSRVRNTRTDFLQQTQTRRVHSNRLYDDNSEARRNAC